MKKLSNLEKEVQRRIEADEKQIDPIDYAPLLLLCGIRWEVSTIYSHSHPAKHPQEMKYPTPMMIRFGKVGM